MVVVMIYLDVPVSMEQQKDGYILITMPPDNFGNDGWKYGWEAWATKVHYKNCIAYGFVINFYK